MAIGESNNCCICMGVMKDYFPIVPFIIPLVPMLLIAFVLWSVLKRLERQDALLEELMAD